MTHFAPTRRNTAMIAAALLVAGLGACSNVNLRETMGIDKNPPDAFSVIAHRKPLEMPPPSAATLPPPRPGAPSLLAPRPREEAQAALFGAQSVATGALAPASASSVAERSLIRAAGAREANIRVTLDAEAERAAASRPDYLLDRAFPVLKRVRGESAEPGALDPIEEYQRLGRLPAPVQ